MATVIASALIAAGAAWGAACALMMHSLRLDAHATLAERCSRLWPLSGLAPIGAGIVILAA